MKWFSDLISNNLFWFSLIAFLCGIYFGGLSAWEIQDVRLHHLQTRYDDFLNGTWKAAQAARQLNEKIAIDNQRRKEDADKNHQIQVDILRAAIKRLQDARARSSFLPPITSGTTNTDSACFERDKLEQALQRLDNGIQGLISEGDEAILGVNEAKKWISGLY